MSKEDVQVLKDALWLINRLAGALGMDSSEMQENYNDSYEKLEGMIEAYENAQK